MNTGVLEFTQFSILIIFLLYSSPRGFIDISGDSYFPYCYMPDFVTAYMVMKDNTLARFIENSREAFIHSQDELTAYNVVAMAASYSPNR